VLNFKNAEGKGYLKPVAKQGKFGRDVEK